jgi:hypothetical protein
MCQAGCLPRIFSNKADHHLSAFSENYNESLPVSANKFNFNKGCDDFRTPNLAHPHKLVVRLYHSTRAYARPRHSDSLLSDLCSSDSTHLQVVYGVTTLQPLLSRS